MGDEDGLDLLLALADDQPEGIPDGNVTESAPQPNAPSAAAASDEGEDEMGVLCRLADEAEAAMVPGSPGAAGVPFDSHDEPTAPGSTEPPAGKATDPAASGKPAGSGRTGGLTALGGAQKALDRQDTGKPGRAWHVHAC